MAAGRAPSNATMTMYVDEASVVYPSKGDKGFGIDVEGNANFSADGTYANGNAGRGWEWRFIPFTVDEAKDVVLSAVLKVSNSWGSIGDFELLSRSLVYIDNWKIAKASAEATLVDDQYAVVGGAVRTALQEAVAKEEPVDGGEEEYVAAAQALKDAETAFKAALSTYQSVASQIGVARALSVDVSEYEAGYPDVGIVASNSLDEYLIESLLSQGAQIDSMGVGENLVTSKSSPVFGGVYKLSAVCRGEPIRLIQEKEA